jgi:ribonuclease T2
MYCRTPSAELLQHEWQAHGACGWTEPSAYFARSAQLYDRVVMPKIETVPAEVLTAGVLRGAFASANTWLPVAAISIATTPRGELTEVRLCFDLAFRPAACADQGAPDARRITLAPSRTRSF